MTKLLNQLGAAPKTALQTYTIEHGIERIKVAVPLKEVKLFEERFARLENRSKAAVLELVDSHGGKQLS